MPMLNLQNNWTTDLYLPCECLQEQQKEQHAFELLVQPCKTNRNYHPTISHDYILPENRVIEVLSLCNLARLTVDINFCSSTLSYSSSLKLLISLCVISTFIDISFSYAFKASTQALA